MAEYFINPFTSATKTHNYFRLSMSEEKNQLNSATHKSIENFIKYLKVPVLVESHLPGEHLLLELGGRARFSLVIFGDYRSYHLLSAGEKALLREFCARHSAGVISFLELSTNGQRIEFANFTVYGRQLVTKLAMSNASPIHHVAKAGVEYWTRNESNVECTLFKPTLSRLNPILRAENELGEQFAVALQLEERHVIFGAKPDQHWLIQIALLDAIAFLAPTIHSEDLERFVQIDIDDVFVGTSGSRLVVDDVQSLHILQDKLREHIADFYFTLGFSGYFFRHGDSSEIRGDEILVNNANKFHWFPHMFTRYISRCTTRGRQSGLSESLPLKNILI
uniref:HSNSD domain-containing protein n=1 Tax=Globodera pallida TaxID=36090 RepID=A0A183BIP0_GLOPA